MIKIYNKTQNEVVNKNFNHMLDVFNFLEETEYGKDNQVLEIYDPKTKTTLIDIEDWGSTKGGLAFYMRKFWKIL